MYLRFIPASYLVVALAATTVAAESQRRVPDTESEREPERKAQPRPADRPAERPPQRRAEPRPPARPAPPAQKPRRGPALRGEVVFIGGYFYDPFFGPYPWWPRAVSTSVLRVEPREAAVTVDGRLWISSDDGHFVMDLPSGSHTVEVSHPGFPQYRRQVVVQDGQSTSLNVSLMGQ